MRWLKFLGAICAALGLIGFGLTHVFESSLMVSYGIRALNTMSHFLIGLAIGGGGATIVGFAPNIKEKLNQRTQAKLLAESSAAEQRALESYSQDSSNPTKTRERFAQLRKLFPFSNEIIDRCIEQMDEMDRLQEKQRRLIDSNDAIYLNETIAVVDEVERKMCRNFRNITNSFLLLDENVSSIEYIDTELVERNLKSNQELLNNVQHMLKLSVDYINQYNDDNEADIKNSLEAWLDVIKNTLREG